ncbi:VCBS repeat-containing protein [Thalassobellus sediminis]|uniref:VCBS repeat-containing protein n=1 Tax=Thalassobellus sediminis TaxID=3367753 RepID=UPI0037A4D457
MKKLLNIIALLLIGSVFIVSCSKNEKKEVIENKIFTSLNSTTTGIEFSNNLTENDSLNYFTYTYLYMGGGIATGDINNDGLIDIYFTGNQVSNKLYLNKGDLKFEDITAKAGVSGDNRWYTGVTMGDVNDDGLLDIYCSVGGKFGNKKNQLFINKGDGVFKDEAAKYGVDNIGNSVQSTFFDYDNDGDLDLYVANYPPTPFNSSSYVYQYNMKNVKDKDTDYLYRNDGDKFVDVTNEAGLRSFGLSLSVTVGDINNDNWPDIYVSNDFMSPDFMYINNQDGTFKEVIKQATSHTALYGMGADISDFNNDGNLDIFQVDMDAKSNRRKKANMASMNIPLFWDIVDSGFGYQYMHNCMQLNSGLYSDEGVPHFSNVSRITGTSSTDWSWGPLFADFDNDGQKDLFVSNGTRKEINNNDYFNKLKEAKPNQDSLLQLSREIPSEKIDNFMFKNKGNLKFENTNDAWGISYKGFSNGGVYADLDNDGDLEIITNNIDDYASVFENRSSDTNNFLQVKFEGKQGNSFGLGNRVYVSVNNQTQMQELTLTRGFQSSVAPELHFGLGRSNNIETLKVVWTDGKTQELNNVSANQKLVLKYSEAKTIKSDVSENSKLFITDTTGFFPKHKHQENENDDFMKQILLPHKMSSFGPALAVGDINNDTLEDYFIGGSAGTKGSVFIQTTNGFEKQSSSFLVADKESEDVGALIFDADSDGDNDLYVVSGGYEFSSNSNELQDRLYINNGNGDFTKADKEALPSFNVSGSRAYNADFNKDGKQDILVLGRQNPNNYPLPANSYLLINESTKDHVRFNNTSMQPSEFENLGMATSAIITDFNNDTWLDIIIVGEWMPIRVFKNTKTGFEEVSDNLGLTKDTTGWWWSINEGDFDNDGDMDYIVGNNGLNYKYKATEKETFDIYVNDFDEDSNKDIVLSYYNEGKQYPVRGRGCSSQQIPGIKKKFKDYESFSEATLADVYTEKNLDESLHYQVKSFASVYLENKNGKFIIHKLPNLAQLSSINQILIDDYDQDGKLDALIVGNLYVSEVETPRNDAGYGLFLKGNGNGSFKPISVSKSGLYIPGDVKDMATIKVGSTSYFIAAKNDDYLQFIRANK